MICVAGAAGQRLNQVLTDVTKFQNLSSALARELQRILSGKKGGQVSSAHGAQCV